MTLSKHLILLFLLISIKSDVDGSVIVKRDNNESVKNGTDNIGSVFEKSLFGEAEKRNLEQEILQELNHLSSRKQREIFDDLEKQHEKFNFSRKSLVLSETEKLSPLNVEELKNIRKTIKTSNTTLPAIRNKRTLNFLLYAVARAMGYTLTPTNPDAEWIPRQQPPPSPPQPQPCSTPAPPCRPNPPSTPPPCSMPPTTPPCPGSNALMQPATVPSNQIDANTIRYPYRPARTIPLFNFAPLPAGLRVPYPPLFQPPAQQRAPCTPQQPSPPPCNTTPAPSPPPCGTTPAPKTPPPCRPAPPAPPPPCGTTPAPSPPPCATTPAPPPPPCKPAPPPPCGATPTPSAPPCMTTPAPPPPCGKTPAPPPPPPCSTPAPPCTTSAPRPPPCSTPAPPCTTPAPPPPPCSTPAPPCTTPAPPPCGNPPAQPPPSSDPPKKGSILLEYDDPVRIQIFSNDKKYLPASGNIFKGHDDDQKEDWHSYFYPVNEKNSKKNEDFEENEEMEEEHIEEEEDEEAPGQLKNYEEEDERILANNEEEEDESETSLSIVKKPVDQDIQKTQKRRIISSKTKSSVSNDNDKEKSKHENEEKSQKIKKPKRKKWIRIVKKQRRKTKMDSNPHNNFQIYTSDNYPQASQVAPKFYSRRQSPTTFNSNERDTSDFSDDSSSHSSEDVSRIDLKKVIVNKKELTSPELIRDARRYEFNFNPYTLEPEDQRRKKLEKAVERYVEDYVEKQLGDELIKNTGVPKTTVFEFAPKNGPKIQTITTTVAKTSHSGNPSNFKPQIKPETRSPYRTPARNIHFIQNSSYEDNSKKRGNVSYETYTIHK